MTKRGVALYILGVCGARGCTHLHTLQATAKRKRGKEGERGHDAALSTPARAYASFATTVANAVAGLALWRLIANEKPYCTQQMTLALARLLCRLQPKCNWNDEGVDEED